MGRETERATSRTGWIGRRVATGAFALLLIEFFDELVYGTREACWPMIRDDLGLSYTDIGMLIGVPAILANLMEPAIGILGDVWNRRALVLGGGIVFAGMLLVTAGGSSPWILVVAFTLMSSASGAFVSLSQATLMDDDPDRRERSMAMWALAGSTAMALSPLVVAGALLLGIGWRVLFVLLACLGFALVAAVWRRPFANGGEGESDGEDPSFWDGIRLAARAARDVKVILWLVLLEAADLMLDVLHGFLALYFVDVVGTSPQTAALAISVWTLAGLPGDALLIPLLSRVDGLRYLRVSASVSAALFVGLLVVEPLVWKMVLLGALGFCNAGWYSILKARLYATMPGRSGTVMAVYSLSGFVGGTIPLMLGLLAESIGLGPTMWVLLIAPISLLIGISWTNARGTSP